MIGKDPDASHVGYHPYYTAIGLQSTRRALHRPLKMPMLYRPPQVSPDLSNGTTSQFDSQRMTNSGQRSHDACVPQAQSQSQSSNSVSAEHHSQSDTNGPSSQSHLHRHSSARDEAYERDAQITFEKTVGGHYRHGKTGYKQVGVLFLTWAADDLQCKKTEVSGIDPLARTRY